jgi:hypothetical protein
MTDPISKVVQLHARRESTVAAVQLPDALAAIRDKACAFLQGRMVVFLDEVDDRLFELADEASNTREQHLYFDAMGEIRVNRESIEKRFSEAFINAFAAMVSNGHVASCLERGQAKLKLLESEALEELIALEGMANKAERRFLHEVWILCTAWQHVVSGPVVAAKELPVGPAKIACALGIACQSLAIDIKAKLIIFKIFDAKVIASFAELYQLLVPVLAAQGLPLEVLEKKTPSSARKSEDDNPELSAAQEPQSASPKNSPSAELVTHLFDAIDNLLGKYGGAASKSKKSMSKPSFMVALQEMQDEQFEQFNVKTSSGGEVQADFDVMAQKLVARLQQVSLVANADVSELSRQHDQDTIDFVGALFQFILDGDALAESLKGLIARLQIPVLKMAMLDKGLFSHDEHPARKLLSALVSAGIGWSPVAGAERDPLYNKTEEVVMCILRDFGVDTQVFADACDNFLSFNEKAKRRAELVARRKVDTEDGKATAEKARIYIAAILARKLGGVDCPPVVTKILQLGWSKVLFLSYIQHGKDSERFNDDAGLIERLLWSVMPSDDVGHRNELIATLPVLLETLRLGFTRVALNSFETDRWLEQLERLHLAKLSRKWAVARGPSQYSSKTSARDAAAHPASMVHSVPLSTQLDVEKADKIHQQASDELVSRIQTLRVGNWVDFRQDDGRIVRCRLAAVINGIGKYIFVNRSGIKVVEFNSNELEAALIDQSIALIDDDRLFDRALESVISNLRDMKDKPLK